MRKIKISSIRKLITQISKSSSAFEKILFITLSIFAVLVSLYALLTQFNFYYDVARDAFSAAEIWRDGNLKIIGPSTDIDGVNHGVLWYYFLAIPYGVSGGNPQVAAGMIWLLLFITSPLVSLLAWKMFHHRLISFLALILYITSPLFQLSTRWVSNPVLGFLIMPLLLYSLWQMFTTSSKKFALLAGVSWGIIIQANFAYAFSLVTLPIFFLLFQKPILTKQSVSFGLGLGTLLLSFVQAEFLYKGRGVGAMAAFLQDRQSSFLSIAFLGQQILDKFVMLGKILGFSFTPIFAFLVIIFLVYMSLRGVEGNDRRAVIFLLVWLGQLLLFAFFSTGITRSWFLYYPMLISWVLLISFVIVKRLRIQWLLYGMVILIVFVELRSTVRFVADNFNPLTVQHGVTYKQATQVVDFTYQEARSRPFSINSITNPLYINTTWAYLYEFYGQSKYGYLPLWAGSDQTGRLGSLEQVRRPLETHFLVIEPPEGIPDFFVENELEAEDARTMLITESDIGNYRVQLRVLR